MTMLIKNGDIINADGRQKADILVEDGTIQQIGRSLVAPKDAEVINARGKYIFPGFIDPHVHIYLPFMGTTAKDNYKTASQAAVVGGTTTLIEMCCPSQRDPILKSYELWLGKAEGNSACDFTFHMGVPRMDKKAEPELREIVKAGIASFKVFLAYKGA
ncbi:MAG: amidohydrolase family protein, partial [Verrucomicrobia bacterium]|nr:amidohydrolase family protein [Verrucomicrobiota bacterium]